VAIALVGETAAINSSSGTTQAVSRTTGAGRCLVCAVHIAAGSSISVSSVTDTASNTWVKAVSAFQTSVNSRIEYWYSANAAAATSVTATLSAAGRMRVAVSEWTGVAAVTPLDISAGAGAAATTTPAAVTVTTTNAGDVVISGITYPATAAPTLGGTFTLLSGGAVSTLYGANAYQIETATGTYGASWTLPSSVGSGQATIALLPAVASPAFTGTSALSGTGTLTTTGVPAASATATFGGAGTLTVTGSPALADTAALTGTGTLTASGVATQVGIGAPTVATPTQTSNLTTATSLVANVPNPAVGAVNFLVLTARSTGTGVDPGVTVPAGWTQLLASVDSGTPSTALVVAWRTFQTGDPSTAMWTWTATGDAVAVGASWPGVSNTTPVRTGEAAIQQQATSSTSFPTPSITLAGSTSWLAWAVGHRSGGTFTAPTAPDTERSVLVQTSASALTMRDSGGTAASGAQSRTVVASAATSVGNTAIWALNPATAGAFAGTAALSGSGSLTAAATPKATATAALTGTGTLVATGKPTAAATAPLTGAGTLAASGAAATAGAATAALTGTGTLTAAGSAATTGLATLSGAGALTTSGSATTTAAASASFVGAGSLAVAGKSTASGTAALAGSGTLTAVATAALRAAAELTGLGALDALGVVFVAAGAGFTGDGALTAGGVAHGAARDIDVRLVSVTGSTWVLTAATGSRWVIESVTGTTWALSSVTT
jgi:hypothetical protein